MMVMVLLLLLLVMTYLPLSYYPYFRGAILREFKDRFLDAPCRRILKEIVD